MDNKQEYNKELKSIVKNAGFGGIGIIFHTLIRFINNALITQHLGAGMYGLYVLSSHIFRLVSNIGQFGMPRTVMRYISYFKGKKDHPRIKGIFFFSFKIVLITSILLLIIVYLFAPFISNVIYEKPEIKEILRILLFSLPATLVTTIVVNSFQGLKYIKEHIILTKIAHPANFTIILLITFSLGYNLKELLYGQVFNIFLFLIISSYILYRKYFKTRKRIKPKVEKKELLKFSYPLYINTLLTTFSNSFPIFFMGFFLINKEIGIYNVCIRLTLLTGFASSSFAIIFLPVISGLYGKGDKNMIILLYKTITKWVLTFTLLITFIIYIYYEPILKIFGKEFTEGRIILLIVVTAQLIANSVGFAGNILVMAGRTKIVLVNSIIMLSISIISCSILIPPYGIIGAATAYAISLISVNIIRLAELYYFEKMHPYNYKYIKPIIASIISFGVLFAFDFFVDIKIYFRAIIGCIFFLISFVAVIWLLKLEEEDKLIIDTLIQKFNRRKK